MKLSHLTVVTFLLSISAFQLGCNNAEKKIPVSKITTEDTIYLEAGKKLAAESQAIPVSYTHLDVYKRQIKW